MNTLDKLFSAIKTASSPRLKEYATGELIRQLSEFEDHILFILKSVYQLVTSECGECRICGARILKFMKMFKYEGTMELSVAATEHVYLQAKDILSGDRTADLKKQKADLIKKLKLGHADHKFLDKMVGAGEDINGGSKLNTADIEEKGIDNVYSFYEAINVLIFSPDWYKRHGALLAYASIFENIREDMKNEGAHGEDGKTHEKDEGTDIHASSSLIHIQLNPTIFSKVYEILKNDKFSDFVDNQTSAPVREVAAVLLKHMYVYINDTKVLEIFMEFLNSEDWQEQFSGLIALLELKEYLVCEKRLSEAMVPKLVELLESCDEDVKYMSAELLDYMILCGSGDISGEACNKELRDGLHKGASVNAAGSTASPSYAIPDAIIDSIVDICWRQIEEEADIAHSKASLLVLLKNIYTIHNKELPSEISSLYPCFTSPVKIIRDSVIELCRIFKNEECLYLLGECILLADDVGQGRIARGILMECVKNGGEPEHAKNFFKHFIRIISLSLYTPYKEDDFACFNDNFFTKDGIQSLGCDFVLTNRIILYKILYEIGTKNGFNKGETSNGIAKTANSITVLGMTFEGLLRRQAGEPRVFDSECQGNVNADPSILKDLSPSAPESLQTLQTYLLGTIQDDFKEYPFLRRMSIKEYKSIIADPSYSSLLMLTNEHALDYIRMKVVNNIQIEDISLYYQLETCSEALRLVTQHKMSYGVSVMLLKKMYHLLTEEAVKSRTVAAEECLNEGGPSSNSKSGRNKSTSAKKLGGRSGDGPQSGEAACLSISKPLRNCIIFFEELRFLLFTKNIIDFIMNDENRLLFFEFTVKFYISSDTNAIHLPVDSNAIHVLVDSNAIHVPVDSNPIHVPVDRIAEKKQINSDLPRNSSVMACDIFQILNNIFHQALSAGNIKILKHFVRNLHYNQLLVKHLLLHFDPSILHDLLDYSDPSFNVLFVNLALINPFSGLLSKIIPSLYFTPNENISEDLLQLINTKRSELVMLVEPTKIPEYTLSCGVSISLRDYQKEGVRWMAFLNRFGLNGILADDMGLGKTVQVLTYMISEMNKCSAENKEESKDTTPEGTKSLVVCPSSLITHWGTELKTYFNVDSLIYNSKSKDLSSSVIIATYDNIRRDAGVLLGPQWFMVVFDEGHLLKSRTTQLYSKSMLLKSSRKFILTGTPIHNSVDDLFSLFNVIMPGYLCTESSFSSNYMVKITEKNVDVMENRLEMLHKKVLPFIMRRLKTEVLKDLPPKIIKDVFVELSSEHMEVYKNVSNGVVENGGIDEEQTALVESDHSKLNYQNLKNGGSLLLTRNMLKAASHPYHFDPSVPSSKTAALKDILSMCGERKVLIFFQLRKTIDYVLEELKIDNYLRLDGTLPPIQRGSVVSRFNSESVQYLFLTTSIGGLGLNLVSADTVIFYEHDWNPFNDLQAMDRAHRLGQKRVVNVFRLISKETIEEKVMNYQNFKVFVASSIVTQQNTGVERMDTKDLLERFE